MFCLCDHMQVCVFIVNVVVCVVGHIKISHGWL